jgi:tRNA U34 5-methylaminomethyl-2-thiouridine-forming methyltransferase MnmC
MKRSLQLTEDGSHTIFVSELDESYHSSRGAIQESTHVFIKQGLHTISKASINILEIGFGTGLNTLLTLLEAVHLDLNVHYHAVEKYPLDVGEYSALNFEKMIKGCPDGILKKIHEAPWEKTVAITDRFSLFKEKSDFRAMNLNEMYDLIYFDAFAPDKQPVLWTAEIFSAIARSSYSGAVLTTYSSKGIVRRALSSSGFHVTKVPGPPGKIEMIRATKS